MLDRNVEPVPYDPTAVYGKEFQPVDDQLGSSDAVSEVDQRVSAAAGNSMGKLQEMQRSQAKMAARPLVSSDSPFIRLPNSQQQQIQALLANMTPAKRAQTEKMLAEIARMPQAEQQATLKQLTEVFEDTKETMKQRGENLLKNGSTEELLQALKSLTSDPSSDSALDNVWDEVRSTATRKDYTHLHPLLHLFGKHAAVERDGANKVEGIKGKILTHEKNLQTILKARSLVGQLDEEKEFNAVAPELKEHLVRLKQNGIETPGLLQGHSLAKLTNAEIKELIELIEAKEKAGIQSEVDKKFAEEVKMDLQLLASKTGEVHEVSAELKKKLTDLKETFKIEFFSLEKISKKDLKRLVTDLDNNKDTVHFQVQKLLSTELEPILKALQLLADIMKKNVDEHNGLMKALLEAMRRG